MDITARLAAMELARVQHVASIQTGAERVAKHRGKVAPVTTRKTRPQFEGVQINKSLFACGQFIAIDGEGVTEGKLQSYSSGASNEGGSVSYKGAPHYMILLAASSGEEITTSTGRLSMLDCLDFFLSVQENNPDSILVCYGGSYDINQALLYDLQRDGLRAIGKGAKAFFTLNGHAYKLEYRARKCLKIWRYKNEQIGYVTNSSGETVEEKPEAQATLWDTIGFFQSSFVTTMEKWLGKSHPDYLFIEGMKARRGEFERSELAEMIVYNQAECRALVEIMDKLRDAVSRLGLTLNRWDGAGAVAAAMNKLHEVKLAKGDTPPDVFDAARRAFSGGHIEVCRFGTFDQPIHHYDVNSAYPDILRELPNLSAGKWTTGTSFDPPPGFTLVKVRYVYASNMPFYPLFVRTNDGCIIYPQQGEGCHWYNEFDVARDFYIQHGGSCFEVLQWWHFEPCASSKPFAFIEEYYQQRKDMVARIKRGCLTPDEQWMLGAEKVIKLGLNSLYGKTAQQVGGRDGAPPPYFQMEWAGYVTAGCRAKIMRAAMQRPGSIISFATDGIFSTEPLDLDCPADKVLGLWEYQTHSGMVVAMPGVYWLFKPGDKIGRNAPSDAYSRGFDKAAMSTPDLIIQAWQLGKQYVDIPLKRLITIGSACAGSSHEAAMWRARGRFLDGMRRLDISGSSQKRSPPQYRKGKAPRLWESSAATPPRANWRYLDWQHEGSPPGDDRASSAAYAIKWLDGNPYDREDFDIGMVLAHEMIDADDGLW